MSYPKLRTLLDLKTKLIEHRHHVPVVVKTKSFKKTNFMQFDKFDVILMKLPLESIHKKASPNWTLDDFQNSLRIDLLADSPSFIVVGCGSTVQGL